MSRISLDLLAVTALVLENGGDEDAAIAALCTMPSRTLGVERPLR